jgi:glucose/mannose-6-phosphate isomerase
MYSVDKSNFKRFLKFFPNQIHESEKIFKKAKISYDFAHTNNILYLGMGGSAIAGDILRDSLYDMLTLPMQVIRGYDIPACCSESSLVIASSYSGNTVEVLSAVKRATERGGKPVIITSGGELDSLATDNNWPVINIPGGYPPRQALGYLLFPLVFLLNPILKKPISNTMISNVAHIAHSIVQRNDEHSAEGKSLSKELAIEIYGKIPIIYGSSPYMNAVAKRWCNQFHENAKSLAFCNVLPELNHNEIVGWEMDLPVINNFIVLFLEDPDAPSYIKTRTRLTKNIISDRGIMVLELYAEGSHVLEKNVSLLSMADWTSYYLALLNEKNPELIMNIDYLKTELKKLG